MRTQLALTFTLSLLILTGCVSNNQTAKDTPPKMPKNIILIIGDGMGPAQLTAAKYANGSLELERCPVAGMVTTDSKNFLVTDSAAGGTALSTGHKTTNGTIAQTPEGEPLKTVLEVAEEKGKSTGLVATCSLTHATPAVFASHIDQRNKYFQIAEQIAEKEIEVIFAGGRQFFLPETISGGKRTDGRNLIQSLTNDVQIIFSEEEFSTLKTPERVWGLFADDHLPKELDGRISLQNMAQKAIELLSMNPEGFFLMVEGSQIDWAGHQNNAEYMISETIDLDNTIGAVLDFAESDGNTLVVITADHETGGFLLLNNAEGVIEIQNTTFGTSDHTAVMVPLFAFGPHSESFGGIKDNTDIGRRLIELVSE